MGLDLLLSYLWSMKNLFVTKHTDIFANKTFLVSYLDHFYCILLHFCLLFSHRHIIIIKGNVSCLNLSIDIKFIILFHSVFQFYYTRDLWTTRTPATNTAIVMQTNKKGNRVPFLLLEPLYCFIFRMNERILCVKWV